MTHTLTPEQQVPEGTVHPRARCHWCGASFRLWRTVHWLCPTPACHARQWAYAVGVPVTTGGRAGTRWLYVPMPKQVEFHAAPVMNLLYGGAAAGMKSHALRWDAYLRGLMCPGYKALILRRTFVELNDTHIERAMVDGEWLGGTYFKAEHKLRFRNGSLVQFGHCDTEGSEIRYLSTEYDGIFPDELVTFDERPMLLILSRARTTKAGVVPVVRAATNPGGRGAQWIRDRFIDHTVDRTADPTYDAAAWQYLPATLDDNPYIDEGYVTRLMALPLALRRAYRFGDWDVFEGQYFKEWRRSVQGEPWHVVPDYAIPASVERFRALDWGYLNNGVCLWIAALPDGRLIVEHEYVFSETLAKDVAAEIKRQTDQLAEWDGKKKTPIRVRYTAADPAMWIRDGQRGESYAETFGKCGVPLIKAQHERVNGWGRLREWLAVKPDGRPGLQVFASCAYTARTLPQLEHDTKGKAEDVDTSGPDHAADTLRYAVMSRPSPTRTAVRPPVVPNTAGALLQDLRFPARTVLGASAVRG